MFVCESCGKEFKRKHGLTYHLDKAKIKCDGMKVEIIDGKKVYNCHYCSMTYTRLTNLIKHREKKHPEIHELIELKNKVKEELYSLQEQKQLVQINNTNSHNDNSVVVNNTNTVNINTYLVNPVTKENIDHIDNETWLKSAKNPLYWVPKLIKMINFSEDYPENHNVMLMNKKDKMYKLFIGAKEWKYKHEKDVLYDLVNCQLDRIYFIAAQLDSTLEHDVAFDQLLTLISNDVKFEGKQQTSIVKDTILALLQGTHELREFMKTIKYDYSTNKKSIAI